MWNIRRILMEKNQISDVILKIPLSIAANIGSNEIIDLLINKALGKKDFYESKIKILESKYGTNYTSFKKRAESGDENNQVFPSHRITIFDVQDQIQKRINSFEK